MLPAVACVCLGDVARSAKKEGFVDLVAVGDGEAEALICLTGRRSLHEKDW